MSANIDRFEVDKTRVKLYFDKWQYKIKIGIRFVHHFRNIRSLALLQKTITRNIVGKHQYYLRWRQTVDAAAVDHSAVEAYYRWRDGITDLDDRVKITTAENAVFIYTNESDIADALCDELSEIDKRSSSIYTLISRYRVDVPKNFQSDAIYRVKPKNNFRVYLHSHRYTHEEFDNIRQFFTENSHIVPSHALKNMLIRDRRRTSLSHQWTWKNLFYDLDDEQEIVLMALKFPELVRCYCRILPRNTPLTVELNDK